MDLADFIQDLLDLGISVEALAGLLDLILGFEQEGLHLAFGKAAVEVEEGAVLGTACMAVAIGFAAFEKAFEQGSMEKMGGEVKRAHEMGFALAKGEGGSAAERAYPTHINK
jgi:hypothetical protein